MKFSSKWTAMLAKCFLIAILVAQAGAQGLEPDGRLKLPQNLVSLNSLEGQRLLWDSHAKEAYVPLSSFFVTQDNLAYCGIATSVMILNSISVPKPFAENYQPYRLFTQANFFTPAVRQVIDPLEASKSGISLRQMTEALKTFPIKIQLTYATGGGLKKFREVARTSLTHPGEVVVVNYLRSTIGQESGGHISPLAAYNYEKDSFLILDVSRYKYPPVWARAADLWQAMNTVDASSGTNRGYLIVEAAVIK